MTLDAPLVSFGVCGRDSLDSGLGFCPSGCASPSLTTSA